MMHASMTPTITPPRRNAARAHSSSVVRPCHPWLPSPFHPLSQISNLKFETSDCACGSSNRKSQIGNRNFSSVIRHSSFVIALLAAARLLTAPAFAADDFTDSQFLAGLRERQLYQLAETFCIRRLQDADLPIEQRAELVRLLSETYVDHARQTPPQDAGPLWTRALEVAQEFQSSYAESQWTLVARVQAALVLLEEGELLRQRAEISGHDEAELAQARGRLRIALRNLTEEEKKIAELLRSTSATARDPAQPARWQLLSLQKNVRYATARASRNQAMCYAAGSPDRDNALTQTLEILDPLARMSTIDPLAWLARLDEITCLRLMKDLPAAARKLDALEKEQPPADIALRARAERVRLQLAAGRADAALKVIEQGREIGGTISPDLDFSILEAQLAAWQAAHKAEDKAAAERWQTAAAKTVEVIKSLHAPYWSRRAETLLASVTSAGGLASDLSLLVSAAQGLYRGGQIQQALAAYDQAVAKAKAGGDDAAAFDLSYTAAAIEHERKNHAAAKERFRGAALGWPAHARAGEAHLLAIFDAAQEARAQMPVKLDEYAALIQEHLRTWPKSATASQAWWYQGRLHEHQRKFKQAIADYQEISPDHERYGEAIAAIARLYAAWLAALKVQSQSDEGAKAEFHAQAPTAAQYFESVVYGPSGALPERWSGVQQAAAVAAARIRLEYLPADYGRPVQYLSAALQSAADAPPAWRAEAGGLLAVALAGEGRFEEAGRVIESFAETSPGQLLDMLGGLSRVAAAASAETRQEIGKLQLAGARLLRGHTRQLSEEDQRRFELLSAQATAAAGHGQVAVGMFQDLAKQYPRDGEIQEQYAALLVAEGDAESLSAALDKWREIERNSAAKSARWFAAKYHVALCHHRLGDAARAKKIIEVTQVLHPDLGGPELKAKFEALLEELR